VLVFLPKGEDGELFIQYGSYGLLRVREGHVASANRDTARANHLGSEDINEDINNVHRRLQTLLTKSSGR
jgi:hypothetical protein